MSTQSTAIALRPDATTQAIGVFEPQNFEHALAMCTRLVDSGFLGPNIKTPNQALAIAMTGHELGFPFMASFRKVYVFQQRIGVMTVLLVAKVKASPLCEHFITEELTADRCTVATKRRGSPQVERYTFTAEMAKLAGFADKNAKYKTEPQRMLYARAAGYLCNDVYSDITMGIEPAETLADEPEHVTASVAPVDVRPIPGAASAAPTVVEAVIDRAWPERFTAAVDVAALDGELAAYQRVKEKLTKEQRAAAQAAYKSRKSSLASSASPVAPVATTPTGAVATAAPAEPAHDPVTGEIVPPAAEERQPGEDG